MTQNDKFHNHPLASDFVVNFYLDNRSLLLDSSMSRTQLSMEHRKLLLKRLTDECRGVYGVHSDQGKIKYHFDNRKARVYKKGHEYKQKMNQSGLSVTEAFKNETDRRLWNYLSNPQKEEYPLTHRFHNAIKEATVSSNLTTDDMDSGGNLLESLLRNGTRLCYEPRQGKDESKLENKLILPSPVSDYVIEYFLKNQNALLENTNSRSNLNILERKQKMGHLTTDILRRFGIATDAHKLKSHFDNKKSRVMRKGLDYVEMVRRGNISNIVVEMFDSESDFKLWRHFQDSQPRDRNNWTVGAELLSKEIKVEAPESIEGEPLNMDTILRHEDEQYSNSTRKRKRESRETEPFVPRPITEDEFRAKQYELMEKQIDFFNKNMELVTSMSSAVSLLLGKIAGLNTPL